VSPARREGLAWVAALLVVAAILALRDYRARDADSVLYARISNIMARRPLSQWIAPAWPPRSYGAGLFREHPAGLFWPAAALARLGYPGLQAAYAMNALYQVLCLILLRRLAAVFADEGEARVVPVLVQLLPIAFVFRVRANHEQALLLFLLLALLGTEKARARPAWGLLTAMGLVGMLLVKGVAAVLGPLACAAWLVSRRREARSLQAWAGVGLGILAWVLVAGAYEAAYRGVTGTSFVAEYVSRQVTSGAPGPPGEIATSLAGNLAWYGGRWLWFAFPWSLVALGAAAVLARRRSFGLEWQGLGAALLVSALYLGVFSLGVRQADRYVFPAYFAAGAAGIVAASRRWPRLTLVARSSFAAPALFLLLFFLHVASGPLGLPHISLD
jgi:4-amino-4-deoxy-L-arabinose transferase-like glycosyltransferase